MLKKTLPFLFFFLFICASNIPSATHCAAYGGRWEHDITWEFNPIIQPANKELSSKRKQYRTNPNDKHGSSLFPNNVIIEKALPGARPGVCYHAAMRETLGLSDKQFNQIEQSILACQDWVTIIGIPYNFFDQQEFPTNKNLATYASRKNHFRIKPFGVVTHNGRIRSKLGPSNYTIEHDYFDLPDWGETIHFWKLQTIYNDADGKQQLFFIIMDIIQASKPMKYWLQEAQEKFLMMAADKEYNKQGRPDYISPYDLLKSVVGLKINQPNSNGETALMLAAQRGDTDFVYLLIEHNADLSLKNKEGLTALELAQHNDHLNVVELLQPNNPYKEPLIFCSIAAVTLAMAYCFYNHLSSK